MIERSVIHCAHGIRFFEVLIFMTCTKWKSESILQAFGINNPRISLFNCSFPGVRCNSPQSPMANNLRLW